MAMNLIDKAKAFAKERHAGQTRKYSGEPYSQHLRSVVQLLDGYRVTAEPVLAAAWLHDTVEDTHTTMQDILTAFGPEVAELVYWMTDTEDGDHETRTRLIAWRLGRAPWEAKMIKLADIIDNCRNVSIHDGEVAATYMAEKRQVLTEMLRCEGDRLEKHPLFQAACLLTGANNTNVVTEQATVSATAGHAGAPKCR